MRMTLSAFGLTTFAFLTGCAEKQTHFGITAPTKTWINIGLGIFALGVMTVVWLLVLLVQWIMRPRT